MDAIFNDALDRAIQLDDKVLLAYFDREYDRDRRRAEGGRKGGRPKKTYGFDKEKERSKEREIYNTHNTARARGRNANVFIPDAEFEELRAGWGDIILFHVLDQLSDKLAEGYTSGNHGVTLRRFCERQAVYDQQQERQQKPANRIVVVNNNYPDRRKKEFIHHENQRDLNKFPMAKNAAEFEF